MVWKALGLLVGTLFLLMLLPAAYAANSLQVLDAGFDPSTPYSLGIRVYASGDDDYDAAATVRYREQGTSPWLQALPLLRRDDRTYSRGYAGLNESTDPKLAGMIFYLQPDTSYDVEVAVLDPDGGGQTLSLLGRTRPLPRQPANPNPKTFTDLSALNAAIQSAQPGDVLTLAKGSYKGRISISGRNGTDTNPIIVRGENRETVIDASGLSEAVLVSNSSNVRVEDFTLLNASTGVALSGNTEGVVVKGNDVKGVQLGIMARGDSKRYTIISNNKVEGPAPAGDMSNRWWNNEGIAVTGQGILVENNTVSGVGDAIGAGRAGGIPNAHALFLHNAIAPNNNDDCYENDFWHWNIADLENLCMLSGRGLSTQPVHGGPMYGIRNVIYYLLHDDDGGDPDLRGTNIFKLNPEAEGNVPSGVYLLHNTAVFRGVLVSYGDTIGNLRMFNNLLLGTRVTCQNDFHTCPANTLIGWMVDWGTEVIGPGTASFISANGWGVVARSNSTGPWNGIRDGMMRLAGRQFAIWPTIGDYAINSPFIGSNPPFRSPAGEIVRDRLLTHPVFAVDPPIPLRYDEFVKDMPDFTLHPQSNAVDAGVVLPNVNDGFTGTAPDLGAWERGKPIPFYGALWDVACTPNGSTEACYTGPAGTKGVGICRGGTRECRVGRWSGCEGEVTPATETCNNQDDDCDGQTDEGPFQQETCSNSIDDDCDGQIDEPACVVDMAVEVKESRGRVVLVDKSKGACQLGSYLYNDRSYLYSSLLPEITAASQCIQARLDNDDKGSTGSEFIRLSFNREVDAYLFHDPSIADPSWLASKGFTRLNKTVQGHTLFDAYEASVPAGEHWFGGNHPNGVEEHSMYQLFFVAEGAGSPPAACTPGSTQNCSTGQAGACAAGTRACGTNNQWGACQQNQQPSEEQCSDAVDNDCDGLVDEADTECQAPPSGTKAMLVAGTADEMIPLNQEGLVHIVATNLPGKVAGVQATVTFDPESLEFVKLEAGEALGGAFVTAQPQASSVLVVAVNTDGVLGEQEGAPLASLTFRGKKVTTSTPLAFAGEVLLSDATATQLPVAASFGLSLRVGSIAGDLNLDCRVDILDAVTFVGFFLQVLLGQSVSPADFALANLDGNGVLDILDLVRIVAIEFGKTC